jgi:hypothetical protein
LVDHEAVVLSRALAGSFSGWRASSQANRDARRALPTMPGRRSEVIRLRQRAREPQQSAIPQTGVYPDPNPRRASARELRE